MRNYNLWLFVVFSIADKPLANVVSVKPHISVFPMSLWDKEMIDVRLHNPNIYAATCRQYYEYLSSTNNKDYFQLHN